MATRQGEEGMIKITREIPLPWLVGIVFVGIVQAAILWNSVQNQGETLKDISAQMKEMRAEARKSSDEGLKQSFILNDHEQRIRGLETKVSK